MPDIVTRRVKNYAKEGAPFEYTDFEVYTREEADEEGLAYFEDWQECSRLGDWGLTDDGFVVMLRRPPTVLGRMTDYDFSIGSAKVMKGSDLEPFEYLPRKERKSWSHKAEYWHEVMARKTRTKAAMHKYVTLYAEKGGHVGQVDRIAAGEIYSPQQKTDQYKAAQWAIFLRTDSGQRLFREMLEEALQKAGITYENVLTKYEETYDQAKEMGRVDVMRGVASDQLKMLKESQQSRPVETDTDFDLTVLKRAVEQIEAPREIDYVEVDKEELQVSR